MIEKEEHHAVRITHETFIMLYKGLLSSSSQHKPMTLMTLFSWLPEAQGGYTPFSAHIANSPQIKNHIKVFRQRKIHHLS